MSKKRSKKKKSRARKFVPIHGLYGVTGIDKRQIDAIVRAVLDTPESTT